MRDFFAPPGDPPADVGELLRLWEAIPDAAGRARVLACARDVAERCARA